MFGPAYYLRFPNLEIETAFEKHLVSSLSERDLGVVTSEIHNEVHMNNGPIDTIIEKKCELCNFFLKLCNFCVFPLVYHYTQFNNNRKTKSIWKLHRCWKHFFRNTVMTSGTIPKRTSGVES
jgi:hypothetical protein